MIRFRQCYKQATDEQRYVWYDSSSIEGRSDKPKEMASQIAKMEAEHKTAVAGGSASDVEVETTPDDSVPMDTTEELDRQADKSKMRKSLHVDLRGAEGSFVGKCPAWVLWEVQLRQVGQTLQKFQDWEA